MCVSKFPSVSKLDKYQNSWFFFKEKKVSLLEAVAVASAKILSCIFSGSRVVLNERSPPDVRYIIWCFWNILTVCVYYRFNLIHQSSFLPMGNSFRVPYAFVVGLFGICFIEKNKNKSNIKYSVSTSNKATISRHYCMSVFSKRYCCI